MAIENSPYVSGLNTNIPANNDPRAEGAAQIRGVKTALKNSFPNLGGGVTATHTRMNEIFDGKQDIKVGMIVMWPEPTIPDGWASCDGEVYNGYQTVDLRDKFVMGKSDDTVVKDTGGDSAPDISANIKVKEHVLSEQEIPAHKHGYVDRYYSEDKNYIDADNWMDNDSSNQVGSGETDSDNDGMLFVNDNTKAVGGGKGHSHGLEANPDIPFDNRPAYVVLQYICYVGV